MDKNKRIIFWGLIILLSTLGACRSGCGCPMAKESGGKVFWTSTLVVGQK
ncbi:MAG TPA: hypothetical protein PLC89_27390 [Haliscomenobacter sp.]|nr:hypothetical protein [Haliscomenobacter sp.]HOY21067.1 hypothetical protein [Haliscomenobacter sp.]